MVNRKHDRNQALSLLATAVLALLPLPGVAAALYGSVRLGPTPARDVRVFVACPTFAAPRTTAQALTDARGGFSLLVPTSGRCEMRAQHAGRSGVPFQVFVGDNPLRFDFEIDAAANRIR